MEPHHTDDWLTVYHGDSRAVMAEMEPESVHCVVTSPPYWGLRDYGTATWLGGEEDCDHLNGPLASPKSTLMGYTGPDVKLAVGGMPFKGTCGRCGATRQDSQLGLEPTPEAYVESMVAVFREVRRVLRSDGTVWLNLGDSYAGGGGFSPNSPSNLAGSKQTTQRGSIKGMRYGGVADWGQRIGVKPKDLVGIPWMVAFALRADGWYLRSDIIWAKPNPMPESVTDRPTKSHEYLFLLSKSPRYYFDAAAVAEASQYPDDDRKARSTEQQKRMPTALVAGLRPGSATYPTRNIRSVWTIATAPYPGAHFATFPPKLVEPCIKAGCPEGGTVLDPFAGSGTTGMVAQSLSRRAVLIDLSMDYLGQLMERNRAMPLGLGA